MSMLLSIRDVGKAYGPQPLFTGLSLGLSEGERVGLIGANGTGKSTLLRILAGVDRPDTGERILRKQVRLAYLAQDDVFPSGRTVEEIVSEPLLEEGLAETELFTRVGVVLGKMGFEDRSQKADVLSGGWRKRLALARELVKEPDALLLDEPTNHLDLESILWLEKMLSGARFAFVVVSHDRTFLENVTNRTIELGRAYPGGYFRAEGPYSVFLERREEFLRGQAGQEASLASKVRREIEWLHQGAKARSTKAKFRKDEAGRLMEELAKTRGRNAVAGRPKASIDFTGTDRQTKRLVVAEGIAKAVGDRTLFSDVDIVLSPGVRLGLVGANGAGKTTLLKILGGETAPDAGNVSRAPNLAVVTFDQNREQLDQGESLRRSLAPYGDQVVYMDRPLHVASWAKRFLFSPEQLDLPVSVLSGGEQARILIAQLMLRPADVLLLDEPTNNLDIPTLEVLEESLMEFPGSIVLITHDRYLLDRVSTVLLGLDGEGGTEVYADYAQWVAAERERERERTEARAKAKPAAPAKPAAKPGKKKLTYREQQEWDAMEERILEAEEALEAAKAAVQDPAVASDAGELTARLAALDQAQAEVDRLYARWEELAAKVE